MADHDEQQQQDETKKDPEAPASEGEAAKDGAADQENDAGGE
jgi:hypothetical protein